MGFCEVFSELLKSRGLTVYQVAKDTKVSESLLGKYRRGERVPSAANLTKLAEYFGVSIDYLLGNEQKNKPTTKSDELTETRNYYVEKIRKMTPEQLKFLKVLFDGIEKQDQ